MIPFDMTEDRPPDFSFHSESGGYASDLRVWLRRPGDPPPADPPRRALTPDECQVVRDTTAPLLHDLAVTGMRLPDIREETRVDRSDDHVHAWIQEPDGERGSGISILMLVPPASRVSLLAEQIQNWALDQLHDAGRTQAWPVCPDHPAGGEALAQVIEGSAVWFCWEGGHVMSAIGDLPG